jgi:hypothetical protein
LPKRLSPSSCTRELLRACSCAPAAGGTQPPRGVAHARPLAPPPRAQPWGWASSAWAPGEPSARRAPGQGTPAPPRTAPLGAAPPRAAPLGSCSSARTWRPRERTRGSRDRMGEMGSGVYVGVAGVV